MAKVGDFEITQQMIDDRNKLIWHRYPNETRNLGWHQLKEAYINAQILVNNGHPITEDIILKEEVRINESTLMPEKLKEIKNLFSNKDSYHKAFVLPVYANRMVYYDLFLNSEKIQAPVLNKAKNFFQAVSISPNLWSELSEKLLEDERVQKAKAKVSLASGFEWIHENDFIDKIGGQSGIIDQSPKSAQEMQVREKIKNQQNKVVSKEGKEWIDELIKPTQPGQVIPKIINKGEGGWLVVRYIGPIKDEQDTYEIDAIIFKKREYQPWLTKEVAKIKIKEPK